MRGGYRQNAGRKKGFSAKNAEEARRLLSERLAQEIEPIVNILITEAKRGNIRAIRELFDRAWGRAPQAIGNSNNVNQLIPAMNFDSSFAVKRFLENTNISKEALTRFENKIEGVDIMVRK